MAKTLRGQVSQRFKLQLSLLNRLFHHLRQLLLQGGSKVLSRCHPLRVQAEPGGERFMLCRCGQLGCSLKKHGRSEVLRSVKEDRFFSCRQWDVHLTCRKAIVWGWASRQLMSSLALLMLLMFQENLFMRVISLQLLLSSSRSTAFRPSHSSPANKSRICWYSAETAFFLSRADS